MFDDQSNEVLSLAAGWDSGVACWDENHWKSSSEPRASCRISWPITTVCCCSLIPKLAPSSGFAQISRKLNPTPANPQAPHVCCCLSRVRGLQRCAGNPSQRCGGVSGYQELQPSSLRCPLLSSGLAACASSLMQSEKLWSQEMPVRGPGTQSWDTGGQCPHGASARTWPLQESWSAGRRTFKLPGEGRTFPSFEGETELTAHSECCVLNLRKRGYGGVWVGPAKEGRGW